METLFSDRAIVSDYMETLFSDRAIVSYPALQWFWRSWVIIWKLGLNIHVFTVISKLKILKHKNPINSILKHQNSLRMWASEWKPTMNIGPLKRVLKAISPWAYIFWGLLRYLVQLKLPFYLGCCVLACASLADSGAMGELQNKIASKLFW